MPQDARGFALPILLSAVSGPAHDRDSLAARLRALSPAARAELARTLRARAPAPAELSGRSWPLSPTQFGIWFHEQLDPGSSAYNNPAALRLRGPLDDRALRRALELLQARHDVLRTRYPEEDGEPVAVVAPDGRVQFRIVDLDGRDDAEVTAPAIAADESAAPFDLEYGPVWRALLVRLAPDDHFFVVTVHHMVSDGWSLGILLRDLQLAYDAFARGVPASLPPLASSYVELVETTALEPGERDRLLAWWTERLAGFPQRVQLPYDRDTTDVTYRGASVPVELSPESTERLDRFCRSSGATAFAGLLASFAALLFEVSGQEDLVVATPLAGRDDPRTHDVVGCFLNTVALPLSLRGDPTPRVLVERCRRALVDALAHGRLPFADLAAVLSSSRVSRARPVTNVMLLENNAPLGALALGDLDGERYPLPVRGVKQDWAVTLARAGGRIAGDFEYTADRFEARTVRAAAARLVELAGRLPVTPDAPLSAVLAQAP